MKPRCILFSLAAFLVAFSCGKTQEEEKPVVKPEIKIPTESQAVFSSGITFPEYTGTSAQESTLSFTATESWTTDVTDTKASSWLSVRPTSGGAGTVNMTVSAQPNPGETERSSKVTIKCGSVSKTFSVTQAGNPPAVIAVESVTLNKSVLTLAKGESETLVATVKPDNATDKTVIWRSSNTDVAIVENGKVAALGAGKATIEAKAGEKTAVCEVTVTVPVESVTLDYSSVTLEVGQSTKLVATVSPSDATDKTVTWTSSDASIATVDDGKVTGIKEGTVAVTALAGGKVASCVVTVAKKVIPITSISLDKTSLELIKGQSESLVVTVKPDDATDKTVIWTSSDATIATVDQEGKVTAMGGGSATITAKAGEKSAACTVRVTVPVSSISLDKSSLAIDEGQTATLTATINPEDASDKTVTWSTSDATVAKVENGTVTAVKEGTATITAKAGDKTAECKVTVSKKVIAVTSVELNKSSLELKKGESEILVATLKPDDATDKTVTWSTSEASVASVDQTGKVTALKSGTATITAKAGDKSATCSVTITTPVESVSLDLTSVTLEEGKTTTLVATINPSDADEKTVEWSTSNASIATVANGLITAVSEGEATITAKAGGKEATCKVLVKKKVVAVTSVSLNQTNLDLKKGESETLVATVAPNDATDKSLSWSSSDASVASVDQEGKVTAIKTGKATITAKAGEKSATCAVAVTTPVESVSLNQTSVDIEEGKTVTLVVTINPNDADEQTVTWTTSDDKVASVANGVVTAVAEGTCTITAKVGGKTAECKVTVKIVPSGGNEGVGYDEWD
ncbi:MAG: Ig-like domain-containing protein [Bacteroidales bacterium]|nr:Ig-like domain-containing protein [Bacteroidales bacterium]